jgi:hypothetical protein
MGIYKGSSMAMLNNQMLNPRFLAVLAGGTTCLWLPRCPAVLQTTRWPQTAFRQVFSHETRKGGPKEETT